MFGSALSKCPDPMYQTRSESDMFLHILFTFKKKNKFKNTCILVSKLCVLKFRKIFFQFKSVDTVLDTCDQCCGSGMIYSGSGIIYSGSRSSSKFSKFRIQAKVPDPRWSGSNPCYLSIFVNCKQNHLKFIFFFIVQSYITQIPEFKGNNIFIYLLFHILLDPDPGKSFRSIRIRIHNTSYDSGFFVWGPHCCKEQYPNSYFRCSFSYQYFCSADLIFFFTGIVPFQNFK